MLRKANQGEWRGTTQQWVVLSDELRHRGIRSPQGFSFQFGYEGGRGNFFWTTNEFAAYLFYKRYGGADPESETHFKALREREDYLHRLSYSTNSEKRFIGPKGFEYRDHQRAGIEYCLAVDNVLIADEQRTGKTIVAIGTMNNLPWRKALILCPKTAKLGWLAELQNWLVSPRKVQVLTAKADFDPDAEVYIANYDILHVRPELQGIDFDIIVADECHLVARLKARRTKFFLKLKAEKILAMSGTPLLNNPVDLLTICQWLDPFWTDYKWTKDRFTSNNGISLTLEEAQELLRSRMMLRRVQAQVFDAEPADQRIVPIEPPGEIKDLIETELRRLQDYAETRRKLGIAKVPYALNHINVYTSEGEKIVVFAHHRAVIERLQASLGSRAVTIYGDTSERERAEAKRRFNEDPSCQVLLGSIAAASMALNLSVSNHIVFVECDWSNGMMEQAQERCSDKEQKKQVIIEYLVFDGSLDYYILNKVDYKDKIADKGLDLVYA